MEPLFFRVKGDFIVVLLSEWLDLNCVGRLDMALTSKTHRPKWLDALREMKSPLINTFEHDHNSLQWMNCRGIRMTKLMFYKSAKGCLPANFSAELIHVLPQLMWINLTGCGCDNFTGRNGINDDVALLIGHHCSRLVTLVLKNCKEGITPAGYNAIFENCKQLTSFVVDNAAHGSAALNCLAMHCTSLEHLEIRMQSDSEIQVPLRQVLKRQPHLKTLVVIIRQCSSLENFVLEPFVDAIVKHSPLLEELTIGGCCNHGMGLKPSPSLGLLRCRKLDMRDCESQPSDCEHIAKISTLQVLSISAPRNVVDDCLTALSKGCPALKELAVRSDWKHVFSTNAFKALSLAPFSSNLEKLTVERGRVDDRCLVFLSRCSRLHTVIMPLGEWPQTVEGLKALLQECQLLRTLHLRATTDEYLQAVGSGCPLLEDLLVEGVFQHSALCAVFSKCIKLRHVDIGAMVTDEDLKCIARHLPNLQTLGVIVDSTAVQQDGSVGWTLLQPQVGLSWPRIVCFCDECFTRTWRKAAVKKGCVFWRGTVRS